MKFFNWLIYMGLTAMLSTFSFDGHAATSQCRAVRTEWVIQVPYAIGYPPGVPDWTPISAEIPGSSADFFNCDAGGDAFKIIDYLSSDGAVGKVAAPDGRMRSVYKTQIDGIGYALGFREPQYCGGDYARFIDGTQTVDGEDSRDICDSSQNAGITSASQLSIQFYLVFYKIPTTTPMQSENMNSQEQSIGTLELRAGNTMTAATRVASPVQLRLASFTVRRTSCTVSTSNIQVDLQTVSKSEFSGIGSTSKSVNFRIPVTCEKNTPIKIGFFGNADAAMPDVLALTQQQNGASGVGIELTYGENTGALQGQRVPLNTQQLQEMAQSGENQTQDLWFNAHYIQTGSSISPGKADSLATFNLIYN